MLPQLASRRRRPTLAPAPTISYPLEVPRRTRVRTHSLNSESATRFAPSPVRSVPHTDLPLSDAATGAETSVSNITITLAPVRPLTPAMVTYRGSGSNLRGTASRSVTDTLSVLTSAELAL